MRKCFLLFFILVSLYVKAGDVSQYKKRLTEVNMLVYSDPHKAIEEGLKWSAKAQAYPDLQVSFLLAAANAYAILKEHDLSFKYAFQARNIAQAANSPVSKIRVLGFISSQYHRLELDEKALKYLEEADGLAKVHPLPDSLLYLKGNILFFKGIILKKKLGNEYALQNYIKAISIFEKDKRNKTLVNSLAILYGKVGDIYIENQQPEKAKPYYHKELDFAEKMHSIKMEGAAIFGLGKVLLLENKTKEAVQTLLIALDKSKKANDIAIVKEIYKSLYDAYGKLGNINEMRKFQQLYLETEKKMLAEEENTLNKLVQKMEKESLKKEKKTTYKELFLFVFLAILLSTILYYLFMLIRKRRRLKSKGI